MRRSRLYRHVNLAMKDLMMHKMRSFLTSLGVVFGVGSVIAMLAVGEGASEQALEQIKRLGSNNIILTSVKRADDGAEQSGRSSFMSIYGLLYKDETRIRESIPHVVRTVPVRATRQTSGFNGRTMELRVVGTTPEWFELVERQLVAGRRITQADMDDSSSVCVLTEYGARRILATEQSIGEKVKLGRDYYEVIGIAQSSSGSSVMDSPDEEIDAYIPFNVSLERYGEATYKRTSGSRVAERVELHAVLVEIDDIENVEKTATAISAMLKHFHRKEDYKMSVPLTLLRQAEATKRTFNIVLGSIAGISLLVGGIGIMNIMLASVTERTREIGIRRAIGARRVHIISQFLVETVVLSGLGGLVGIAIGVLFPWLITRFFGMPTVVPVYSIVLSTAISVTIGVVFGIYPAVRAANLDPIEALRHE